jgi:hypothetical protein
MRSSAALVRLIHEAFHECRSSTLHPVGLLRTLETVATASPAAAATSLLRSLCELVRAVGTWAWLMLLCWTMEA